MQHDLEAGPANRERVSALVDGELEPAALASAWQRWHDDAGSRAAWRAYHLIGDVLRSDDLANDPVHDAAFIDAFRARLALEPIVLAPVPRAESEVPVPVVGRAGAFRARRSWFVPAAAAAGFVAVAGVLTVTHAPSIAPGTMPEASLARSASPSPSSSALLAVAQPSASSLPTAASATGAGDQPAIVATGQFIRDARLDRYLAAHKQFAGSSALGVPSAYLRNATAETAGR